MRILSIVKSYGALFLFISCAVNLLAGCTQKSGQQQAQGDAEQADAYYQKAVIGYKDLIAQGKDTDAMNFELGRLYYDNRDFSRAQEALRKTNDPRAKRFLATAYYQLGNFVDSLEIFERYPLGDAEYAYYHGLVSEKLNLYDRALAVYRRIEEGDFHDKSRERIEFIERRAGTHRIEDMDPQVSQMIAEAPSQEQYPQAGALILYCDEEIEVTPENTSVTRMHYLVKILNERGKEGFSETQIGYDSTYEKVELEYARTIKPDGTVVEVGSRHMRDVSKYLNFPLYSNARVCIISFPEITEGACIEYRVKVVRNQLIDKKNFVLAYPVQSSEPILKARFKVSVPQGKDLRIKTINEEYNAFGAVLMPIVEEKAGARIYRWEYGAIPQIIPETNMPDTVEINPTVVLSTFDSWDKIYRWWWDLAKDKISADDAIKEKVKGLTANAKDDLEKIQAIYAFCAQKIRYVAVEYGQAGYEPHQASLIFQNKYGDCKDQSILLVTMLKEAGFSAWPVLIATKDYYNLHPDFPAMLFDHCIAAVSAADRIVFLDPTAETCAFDDLPSSDQKRRVLVVKEDGYLIEETPLYPAAHNLLVQESFLKINPDETVASERTVSTHGIYDQAQRYWLLYTQPERVRERLKEKVQGISIGGQLEEYTIENLDSLNTPIVLRYSFRGPEYFTCAGALRIMPQLSAVDTSLVAKEKRKYPIEFAFLDRKETILEIALPPGFGIQYLPEGTTIENRWMRFTVEYSRKDAHRIFFRQRMDLKTRVIPQDEYAAFKVFLEETGKKVKQRIVIEKKR